MIKKLLPLLLLILIGCSESKPKIIDLNSKSILKDGVYLDKESMKPLNGRVIKTSPDNIVIIDGFVKDGIPNGDWNQWYVNGSKHFSGYYTNGVRDGVFTHYNIDGFFISEYEYTNGELNGIYRNNSQEGTYVNGKKNGLWKGYSLDKLVSQIQYNNDIFDGIYDTPEQKGTYDMGIKVDFWEEKNISIPGSIRKGLYKKGKRDGVWIIERNGIEISRIGYKENILDGIFQDKNIEGYYKLGIKDGTWKTYDDQLRLLTHIDYKNGVFDGKYKTENKDGQYLDGKKTGLWIEKLNSYGDICSEVTMEGNYLKGLKEGEWKTIKSSVPNDVVIIENYKKGIYDGKFQKIGNCDWGSGTPKVIGNYKNGMKDGVWKKYNNDGNIVSVESFINNQLTETSIEILYTSYDSNSVDLLITKDYSDGKLNGKEIFYRPCYNTSEKKNSFYPTYVRSYKNNKLHGWSRDTDMKYLVCIMKSENERLYHQETMDGINKSSSLYFEGEKIYSEYRVKFGLSKKSSKYFFNNSKNFKTTFLGESQYYPNTVSSDDWKWFYQDQYNSLKDLIDKSIDSISFDTKISDL